MDPVVKKLADILEKQNKMIKKLAQQKSLEDAMREVAEHPELHTSAPGLKQVPGTNSNPQADDSGVDIGKVAPMQHAKPAPVSRMPAPDKSHYLPVDTTKALVEIAKRNGVSKGKFNTACLKYVTHVTKTIESGEPVFHFSVSKSQIGSTFQLLASDPSQAGKVDQQKKQIVNQDDKIKKMLESAVRELNPGKETKYTYNYV